MIQIRLPANAEHLAGVHTLDVFERDTAPTGQAQILIQAVEEPLHVVGNQTPQPVAHLLTRGEGQVEVAGLRERGKAVERGLLGPGLQIQGREDVCMSTESRLLQDRLQPYAAGEDEAYPVSVVLAVLAQPTQEFVDILFSPRRDAVVVILEHPVDEDRKLVDREHHRPLILRQGRADRVALLLPASAVDPSPQLHAPLADGQRLDFIVDPMQDVGESGLDSVPRTLYVPRLHPDLDHGVRRRTDTLQIDEDRLEAPLGRQAAQQFPNQARLAHSSLRGQQRMGSVPHSIREYVELSFPVEEAIPIDPVRPRLLQSCHFISQRICCQL